MNVEFCDIGKLSQKAKDESLPKVEDISIHAKPSKSAESQGITVRKIEDTSNRAESRQKSDNWIGQEVKEVTDLNEMSPSISIPTELHMNDSEVACIYYLAPSVSVTQDSEEVKKPINSVESIALSPTMSKTSVVRKPFCHSENEATQEDKETESDIVNEINDTFGFAKSSKKSESDPRQEINVKISTASNSKIIPLTSILIDSNVT
ncbi:unnamed protein product, partial [Hymenolepis diminuta]